MKKWFITLVICFIIITLTVLGYFYKSYEKADDYYCEKGFGSTTIKLKVLDFYSKKSIDSIRLIIYNGISMHKLIDSVFKQENGLVYNFTIPEMDDCESYWFEVSNKLYYDEIYFADSSKDAGLKKGATNESTIYLKPATKVNIVLKSELKNCLPV